MDKYDKEIDAIPAELRKLRIQKYELDSYISKAERQKAELSGEIEAVRAVMAREQEKRKALVKQNNESEAEIKSKKADLVKEEGNLKKRASLLDENSKNLESDRARLVDAISEFNHEKRSFKSEVSLHRQAVEAFKKEQAEFEAIKVNKQAEIGDMKASLKEKENVLQCKLDDVAGQISKVNDLEHKINSKLSDAQEAQKRAETAKKQHEAALKGLGDERKALADAISIAQSEEQKAKSLQFSLGKQIQELNNRDKELRARELRVQKLIRDKNLDAELKQLEEESKK